MTSGIAEIDGRALFAPSVRLNWRPEGVTCYESIWSILHKLVYLNRVNSGELCAALADPVRFIGSVDRKHLALSLNSLGPISGKRLGLWLQLDPAVVANCITEPYRAGALTGLDPSKRLQFEVLRFCRACMKRGFHSPLYQLMTVARCPIHDQALEHRCPHCNSEIGYDASSVALAHPYGCRRCGRSLWPGLGEPSWLPGLDASERRLFDQYQTWVRDVSKELGGAKWALGLASVAPDDGRARRHAFRYATDLKPLDAWSPYFTGANEAESCASAEAPTLMPLAPSRRRWKVEGRRDLLFSLLPEFYPLYKSVRRHLTKRFLRRHRRCRRLSRTQGISPDVNCMYVQRMRVWRMRWERSPFEFEQRFRWEDEFLESTPFLYDLLSQVEFGDRLTEDERTFMRWLGGRWYVFLLLASFRHLSWDQGTMTPQLAPNGMPFFYWQPASGKGVHRVTWWSDGLLKDLDAAMQEKHSFGRARYQRLLRDAAAFVEREKRRQQKAAKRKQAKPRAKA